MCKQFSLLDVNEPLSSFDWRVLLSCHWEALGLPGVDATLQMLDVFEAGLDEPVGS